MAAANESQGLKIAVAAFVSLTVILAVTSYFLYSNWSQTDQQLAQAKSKMDQAKREASTAVNDRDEMRKLIGTKAEDFDAAKTEIKARQKEIDDRIAALPKKVDEAVAKAQAGGVTGPELQEHAATIKRLVQEYQGEVNKSYISSLARMTDIYDNLNLLNTSLAMAYTHSKRSLESSNTVNKTQTDALSKAVADLKSDLESEHKKHEELRGELLTKVDTLQTERDNLQTQVANLTTEVSKVKEDTANKRRLDMELLREYRDRLERDENVLDVRDGTVTYVDYRRNEIHTNINRSMGARPQMVLSIFDAHAPGIPTEKPKGTIELIQVGDRYSIARIVKTMVPTEPIRIGDIVHSAAWSPNEPVHFALIGKIDVNRDGRDDREDLKRMIQAAGGIVDYDLPPPGAGKEKGQLTARDAWYVVDERSPFHEAFRKADEDISPESVAFRKKQAEVMREARLNGVRPIKVERLLAYLGYDFAAPVTGRTEAYDKGSMKLLVRPREEQQPGAASSKAEKKDEEKKGEDMKGDEEKKDEEMKGDEEKSDKGGEKDQPK